MNGVHLLHTLKELGCPIQDDTLPESVDWMFADDEAVPFLEWFCTNADPSSNRLTSDELKTFAELSQRGLILEGEQLTEAHENLMKTEYDKDDTTEAELEQEIEMLKTEYEAGEQRIEKLIQMTNRLSIQQTSLTHKASKNTALENKVCEAYRQQMKEIHTDDENFDGELKKLSSLAEELIGQYNEKQQEQKLFLSQQSMEMHDYAHQQLMQEMRSFTQKQFFQGISQIPSSDTNENYQMVDIKSADHLGTEKEKILSENSRELARLWKVYIQCELARVAIIMKEERLTAELRFLQDKLKSYQIPGRLADMNTLHRELQDVQRNTSKNSAEITKLLDTRIRNLVNHCANSQSVRVLQGDYDLKIARQDYFISNQEKVINQLIKQQSLYEFLAMCSAKEIHEHQTVNQLLTAVTMDLRNSIDLYQKRQQFMQNPDLSRDKAPKTVVDTDDHVIQSLHEIVDPVGHSNSLYVTFSGLSDVTASLAGQLKAAENCDTYVRRDGNEKLDKLEKTLKGYESRLYSESSTMKGVPQLSPQQLVDVMKSLESCVEKFEAALLEITKEIKNKRSTLDKNVYLQEERKLFLKFFTDPERLKAVIEELGSRVEARSIGK